MRRRDAVLRAVAALMCEGKLWLTAWGRSMPGSTSDKHRIKAADLANQKLHSDLSLFFRALAHRLIGRIERPVIAIVWTDRNAGILQLQNLLCSVVAPRAASWRQNIDQLGPPAGRGR